MGTRRPSTSQRRAWARRGGHPSSTVFGAPGGGRHLRLTFVAVDALPLLLRHRRVSTQAAIRKLEIQGSSFCQRPSLAFQPPLTDGVDYSITGLRPETLLTRKPHKKWRYEAAVSHDPVLDAPVELASGQGIVVATVRMDPTRGRKIYATQQNQLYEVLVNGRDSTDGTELTLRPCRGHPMK